MKFNLYSIVKLLLLISFISFSKEYYLIIAKDLSLSCDINFRYMDIDVEVEPPLEDNISFSIQLESPNTIKYKCMLVGTDNKIFCSFFEHYSKEIVNKTKLIFQQTEPEDKRIKLDHESFTKISKKKYLIPRKKCSSINKKSNLLSNWSLIFEIKELINGECKVIENKSRLQYNFNMTAKIVDGVDKNNLEKVENENKNYELKFLEDIWMPIALKTLRDTRGKKIFTFNSYYNYAFCSVNIINQKIFKNNENITFSCSFPIDENITLSLPIKIESFNDQVFSSIKDNDDVSIKRMAFSFNINNNGGEENKRDSLLNKKEEINLETNFITEINEYDSKKSLNKSDQIKKIRSVKEKKNIKPKNDTNISKDFLILDEAKGISVCPYKPVFIIKSKDDIIINQNSLKENNFTFELRGNLVNGYLLSNNQIISISATEKEKQFDLILVDNLIDKNQDQNIVAQCFLQSGTFFSNEQQKIIKCKGNKIFGERKNIDLTLNLALKENKYHEELIIFLTTDKIKTKKNLYSYDINALSIKRENHSCIEDKYNFFIEIDDLAYEPNLSFNISLSNPEKKKAQCKIYDSSTLACEIDLKRQKLYKNDPIALEQNIRKTEISQEGNIVNFFVGSFETLFNNNDTYIKVSRSCGNSVMIAGLEGLGLSYKSIIILFILFLILVGLIIFAISFCIIKRYSGKIKKNKYFAQYDEEINSKTIGAKDNPVTVADLADNIKKTNPVKDVPNENPAQNNGPYSVVNIVNKGLNANSKAQPNVNNSSTNNNPTKQNKKGNNTVSTPIKTRNFFSLKFPNFSSTSDTGQNLPANKANNP